MPTVFDCRLAVGDDGPYDLDGWEEEGGAVVLIWATGGGKGGYIFALVWRVMRGICPST